MVKWVGVKERRVGNSKRGKDLKLKEENTRSSCAEKTRSVLGDYKTKRHSKRVEGKMGQVRKVGEKKPGGSYKEERAVMEVWGKCTKREGCTSSSAREDEVRTWFVPATR